MKMKAEERALDAPQVAEAKVEEGGLAIEKNPYGKFKDSQSLLKAYESLESEFTRRSQRLKTLEGELLSRSQTDKTGEVRKNQETEDITGRYSFVSKYGREIEDELTSSGNSATRLVDLSDPCAIIPNVAIHMNRNANDGMSYNPAVDMIPLCGEASDAGMLRKKVAEAIGVSEEDILTTDLFLYNPQRGVEWNGYVSAPRLDDLQCAFASLTAFVEAGKTAAPNAVPVFCLFDNEEVGSQTKQGAASTFLFDTLNRLCEAMGLTATDMNRKLSSSFLVSCDNAHAVHPNHPEYKDANHAVYMNGGIVVKYNANQRYTTDGISAALFGLICEVAGVPIQRYANRADMPGGSTLGNIANTQVSLNTVDIGLAQLAMHSAYETAGARDTALMVKALTRFFVSAIVAEGNGAYTVV